MWKLEQVIGISRDTVQAYNDRVRKVKAYLELNVGRDLKGKKDFYRYISSKRMTRGNVGLLLNGTGIPCQQDQRESLEQGRLTLDRQDQVRQHLNKLIQQTGHIHGPWDLMSSNKTRGHGVWRRLLRTGRNDMFTLIFEKGKKGRTTGQSALPQFPRKVMDQILLEAISKHMKGKMVTEISQHGFKKRKPWVRKEPDNLTAFYHKITILVDKGRTLDGVYLDFSKCFDAVSRNILMDKLMKYRIGKQTMRWTENWLNCQPESLVISNRKSRWRPATSGVPQWSFLSQY
ncbi:rna-directed dna polymerase from mobile element jockey- hypothetical protein [Limosa lapponica baueri]|uniref:Uncharacterized protein n=1 Tax=Limosa lapponica baueri TaxID=1758121 RepID=A0A2I0UGP9_LIMLA|nr:rna-directed dna polymerase from mobile element jockey- hypothetical protein [Limosa lapponica baueri]